MLIIYLNYVKPTVEIKILNIKTTLKEETFAEETIAISRFFTKFAKVCSAEYSLSINRESLLSRKNEF